MSEFAEITIQIKNLKGLHARATSEFVRCAENFQSEITVIKKEVHVSGKSIMGLLMLGAGFGETLTIRATGEDAENAIATLKNLIEAKFGEPS